MRSGIALFGLSYIASIIIFVMIGEIGIALLAAFISAISRVSASNPD